MLPRVCLVYLSYNNRLYLEEVFSSWRMLDYPSEKLEIIVVDNASTDGSQEWLRAQKGITFFPSGENLGFAQGNNMGIEHALLSGAEYVYLLNGDAKLHPDAIKEAVFVAESDHTIGAVQSRIMLWKHPGIVNVTGGMVHFLGFGFAENNGRSWEEVKGEVNDGQPIAYPSGAAVLYRASVLQKVGLLDPFLFLYHEDLELGWRIRLAGFTNVLSTESIAYHDYEFKRSIQKFYWMERNRILVHFSHLHWSTLVWLMPFLFFAECGLILFSIKGGWFKQKCLVYVNLLSPRTWAYVAKKRRESRLLRRVSDREIVSLWTGKIEHQETNSPVVDQLINPFLSLSWGILKKLIRG